MRYNGNMLPACVALAQVMGTTLVAAAPLAQVDDCGMPQVPNLYKRGVDAHSTAEKTGLQKRGLYGFVTGLLGKNCSTKSAQQEGQGLPREQAPTGASQRQEIIRQEDDNVVVTFPDPVQQTIANTGVSGTGMNANPVNPNPIQIDLGQDMNRLPFPVLSGSLSENNPFVPSANAREFYRDPNLRTSVEDITEQLREPIRLRIPPADDPSIYSEDRLIDRVREEEAAELSSRRGVRGYFRKLFGGSQSKSPVNSDQNADIAYYSGTNVNPEPRPVAPLTNLRNQRARANGSPVNFLPQDDTIITNQVLEGLTTNPETEAIRGPTRLVVPLHPGLSERERAYASAYDALYGPDDVQIEFPEGRNQIDLSSVGLDYLTNPEGYQPGQIGANNAIADDTVANLLPAVNIVNANPVIEENVQQIVNEIVDEVANNGNNILPADINAQPGVLQNAAVNDVAENLAAIVDGVQNGNNGGQGSGAQSIYFSFSDQLGTDPLADTGIFGEDLSAPANLAQSQFLPASLLASQVGGPGGQQGGNANYPIAITEEDRISFRSDEQNVDNGNDSRDISGYEDLADDPAEQADVVDQNLPAGNQLQNVAADQLYASFNPGASQ
ncbi:hypothetical protein ABW21_db0202507 [Orbilia brochopaga]|nr:hypothetical protein ABW21_db0202507 [Drechslerella brochopaga]